MKLTPFGKLVRQHRLEREITLSAMCVDIGVTAAFASAVETGSKSIPADYPEKVGRALHLTPAQMLDLTEAAELSVREVRIALDRKASRGDREVVAMFARRFQELPEDRKQDLRKILEESNK